MAILIPSIPKQCPASERVTYTRLGKDLDHDWVVLHSLGFSSHETKIWGEGDIVVLSTLGFFSLEVKGSRTISCKNGVWTFESPQGTYQKKESPWGQAQGTMRAVEKALASDSSLDDVMRGFGVVMPMTTFTIAGPEIDQATLLDRRHFHESLKEYINALSAHWKAVYQAKHQKTLRMPTRADIKLARSLLRPDFESATSIGSHLNSVEQEILQLSNDQIRASRRMKANPRTVVRGKAGTGKTVIAVDRAMQLSKEGKRVLYLCFNQLLAHHIRESLAKMPEAQKFSVLHVHALYHDAITRAGMLEQLSQADTDEQTLYGVKFPRLFVDAMLDLDALPWDALIVDEAQDLLTPDNLDAFDLLLAGGLNEGCWHFFLDPLQNIYGTEVQDNVDVRLKAAQPAYEDLFENCRNTRQVAVQASITSGIDLALEGAPDGPECGHVFFNGFDSFKSKIVELIEHWRKEDIRPEDIAILSTRRRANSLLKEMTHISGIPVVEALSASKGQIAFSTMHGFKGLERRAVIAIDMDEIGQAGWSMLHYTGLSRARTLLKAFVPESRRGAYAGLASDYAQKLRSS